MDETARTTFHVDVLLALTAAAAGAFWLRKRQRREGARRWPLLVATLEGHSVEERNKGGEVPLIVFVLRVSFSYVVDGSFHRGTYKEELPTQDRAERQYENHCSLPFYIRCNPTKPAEYFVDPYADVRGTGV